MKKKTLSQLFFSHLDHPEHEKHVRRERLDGDGFDGRVRGERVDSVLLCFFFRGKKKKKVRRKRRNNLFPLICLLALALSLSGSLPSELVPAATLPRFLFFSFRLCVVSVRLKARAKRQLKPRLVREDFHLGPLFSDSASPTPLRFSDSSLPLTPSPPSLPTQPLPIHNNCTYNCTACQTSRTPSSSASGARPWRTSARARAACPRRRARRPCESRGPAPAAARQRRRAPSRAAACSGRSRAGRRGRCPLRARTCRGP